MSRGFISFVTAASVKVSRLLHKYTVNVQLDAPVYLLICTDNV